MSLEGRAWLFLQGFSKGSGYPMQAAPDRYIVALSVRPMRCRGGLLCLLLIGVQAGAWLVLATLWWPPVRQARRSSHDLTEHAHKGKASSSSHAYVALCSIFKNEHGNLQEWVQYHRWLGVGKFYIFDHGSSPPLALELEEYVREGLVELHYFAGDSWQQDEAHYKSSIRQFLSPQTWAYDNCFRWFGKRHAFIGMLDADEYVVIRQQDSRPNLTAFLQPFESHGGLVMQWQLLGPSGHSTRPASETMLAYTSCIPKETLQGMVEFQHTPFGYLKSFTNTRFYRDGCDPHRCSLRNAKYANEDFVPVSKERLLEVHWSRIAVFHYVTRSIDEYEQKMSRGSGHSQYAPLSKRLGLTGRGWQFFVDITDKATGTCRDGVTAYQACCAAQACTCTGNKSFSIVR